MYANGFLEERRRSPASLATVIGLHAAALGAVMVFGTTTFLPPDWSGIKIITIQPDPPIPPEVLPPPPRPNNDPTPRQIDQVTVPPTNNPPIGAQTGPVTPERPYQEPTTPPGPVHYADATPRVPDPVRHAAMVDPNYRDALQPPYPRDMETAGRNGSVRVRITIGTDGRVSAIEQLSATDASFWRVTERQARGRWRFRPATVDGRPIVSTMVMTVTFRIPDEA
jgi:protein TonB